MSYLMNSPTFTGNPQAPTVASAADSSNSLATTHFVQNAIGAAASNYAAATLIGTASGLATLDSGGKLTTAQIPSSLVGGMSYQGTWNATINSPALASGVGTKGYFYKVGVAGATSIDGCTNWNIGDMIAFDGTTWDKFDGPAEAVISVNGATGAVTVAATNQTMYIGTTAIAINAGSGTITSLAGLTSVTATTFTGSLTGNASGSASSITGNLTGDVTSVGMATTLTAATVVGKSLTGFSLGTDSSALAVTDTILQAFQKLQYQGNLDLVYGISTKTTTYNPTLVTDRFIRCDATSGAFSVTLLAAPVTGQMIFFKKIDSSSNAITVNGNGKNIDGVATCTLMQAQYNSFGIIYNGASWDII